MSDLRAYYPVVKELVRQIHSNAQLAAQAAGRQGKFWEMHDILFEKQNEWSNAKKPEEVFIRYAKTLGLDTEQFKNDLSSDFILYKYSNREIYSTIMVPVWLGFKWL